MVKGRPPGPPQAAIFPLMERRFEEILQAIERLAHRHGYPPTLKEIGNHIGLKSKGDVHRYVSTLIAKGYLKHQPGKPRTLRRTKKVWK